MWHKLLEMFADSKKLVSRKIRYGYGNTHLDATCPRVSELICSVLSH
jgi:hypothetical protein